MDLAQTVRDAAAGSRSIAGHRADVDWPSSHYSQGP